MRIFSLLLLVLSFQAFASGNMRNPFSDPLKLRELGLKREVMMDPSGKKLVKYTHRDGSRTHYLTDDKVTIIEDFDEKGNILRIERQELEGITKTTFDEKQQLSTKSVYTVEKGVDTLRTFSWDGEKWILTSTDANPEMLSNGDELCDPGVGKDINVVGVLARSYKDFKNYDDSRGNKFKLDIKDCGWYGNAKHAVEGKDLLQQEFGEAMQKGAQCLLKLDSAIYKKAKGSPQAKMIVQAWMRFGGIFDKKLTLKCGVDDYTYNKEPWSKYVRPRDQKSKGDDDQTMTMMSHLRAGSRRLSGRASLCKDEASHQFLSASEIPGVALNMFGNSGDPMDPNTMPPGVRKQKLFHEVFHLTGFAHERNSGDADLVQDLEECCFTSLPMEKNDSCNKIINGEPIKGRCPWGPNGKCN